MPCCLDSDGVINLGNIFDKDVKEILGDEVIVCDGGEGTAREMKRRLDVAGLLNPSTQQGMVIFENSLEENQEKIALCKMLLEL